MATNTSAAVMQQRAEPADSLDYFPTPPWATRALMEHVLRIDQSDIVLEPACGEGHMAEPLREYSDNVIATDVFDYGYGQVSDYLTDAQPQVDWVITNPPYNLALEFIKKSLTHSNKGVAVILRSAFIESQKRYDNLFKDTPPSIVAPFVERVAMVKGKYDVKAGSAMSYAWFIWQKDADADTRMIWIPPSKTRLFKDSDTDIA